MSISAQQWWLAKRLACGIAFGLGVLWAQAAGTPPEALGLSEGASVDIAPWGERASWAAGQDLGLWWEDPRETHRVEITFAGTPPDPAGVRLQWWQSQWPEHRIPRDRLAGAGESGWLHLGDSYQGRWRDADVICAVAGSTYTYTFRPLNQKEFPNLRDFPAEYRSSMRLRFMFSSGVPQVKSLRVFSESVWKCAEVALEWGGAADQSQVWDGRFEGFNGYTDRLEPLRTGAKVEVRPDGSWRSTVKGKTAGVTARVWYTESPNVHSFDKTVITVRARQHSFSFDPAEVAKGRRVFAPAYGVLVRKSDQAETYAQALAQWKANPTKNLYDAVFAQPEQTFSRAWSDMPPRRQFYIPLGTEGGRQRFGVDPDGSAFCVNDRIDQPRGRDTERRTWGGHRLRYSFGLPPGPPAKRWIEEQSLPIIHAQWQEGGLRYTQTAFATRFAAGSLGPPDLQADDTVVLMVRISVENIGDQGAPAAARLGLQADGKALALSLQGDLVFAQLPTGLVLRGAIEAPEGATTEVTDGKVVCSGQLPPGQSADLVVKLPFITLDQPAEQERLRGMDFGAELERVRSFWRARADASTQIRTPVPQISDFYRAHVSHLLINCGREVGSDRLMARVGSFGYGVYGNESCMMITDLDRRGLHREAEKCLETFLHYQGTVALPGDYTSQEGVFNGANGWESGGYNQHHGWIMWAMAEHYWYSGDAEWLRRNADRLLKACQWITKERQRSKGLDPKGLRGIELGLLPPGSLEDIGDWRCWMSNNGFSWWGLDSVARALADIQHPQAAVLQAEAAAYRKDILTAFREAMVRAPLVPLRDGSYIPQIPSEVHRRGRTFGWITTTLEGSIYFVRTGLLDASDPLAKCIMQDYEDNLYLSEQYGYSPKHLPFWFSRGGFSMQPNLLCSPHPYLLRDEVKHFLRSYFNAFAASYYPDTQMMTEHPLPDLGDWRGDHYKSSDESNSTYWLRLMFVDEEGRDLYLGRTIPRAWLVDGAAPGIERAATWFGPMSLRFESQAAKGSIRAVFDPPKRRAPQRVFLRFRHPEERPLARVTIDGKPWTKFQPKTEMVELPVGSVPLTVEAFY